MEGKTHSAPSEAVESRVDNRRTGSADAILDAAESLFGRHGTEGVSLRQIAVAAGSANHSAVQYYFSSKEGLMRGIFERRLKSLERARTRLLDQATERGEEGDLRVLLTALLRPIAEERDSEGRCSFAAFLLGMRLFADIKVWSRYSEGATVTRKINDLMNARLEALALADPHTRIHCAVVVFLVAVIDWDRGITGGEDRSSSARDRYLERVLDFAASGLQSTIA
ncbi:TetR/AcrR family transcriptional regulator [Haliea sp. E17]|uniref:TetR/AcrR family transcriptional regulator n=1 Tax=Haliea sp. E17 TaxID=3401576 RepID=UPI003AAD986F